MKRTIMESERIFGHEPMGVVEEVGDAFELVKPVIKFEGALSK